MNDDIVLFRIPVFSSLVVKQGAAAPCFSFLKKNGKTFAKCVLSNHLYDRTATDEKRRLLVSVAKVSIGTLIARIFGLLREVGMAALFGTGIAADAFAVAFRFPNLLKNIVGEGAFSAAFLPKFTEVRLREGQDAANALSSYLLVALSIILAILCALGIVFAPQVVDFIVIGWQSDPARKALAVSLVRIMFGLVAFTGLASYCQAILNSHHRFFISALAPASMNLIWFIGIAIVGSMAVSKGVAIKIVAVFVVVGSAAQFLWQLPFLFKLGWRFDSSFSSRGKDLAQIGRLFAPSLLTLAASEFYYLADVMLASFLPSGSVSSLTYANRLLLFPLGLVGFSVATAALPGLSDSAARKDLRRLSELLSHTTRSVFLILLPLGIAALVLRYELVALLFERGSFDASRSTPMVVLALGFYMLGLPFFGLQRVLTQGFYALKDTATPVVINAISIIINIELSMILMGNFAHGGLALGSSLAAFLNVLALLYYCKIRLPELDIGRILRTVFLVSLSCAFSAGATVFFSRYFSKIVVGGSFAGKAARFFVPAALFFIVFWAIATLLKVSELDSLTKQLTTKFWRKNS